jgi:hypothetical protein
VTPEAGGFVRFVEPTDQVICPTGKSLARFLDPLVKSLLQKYFCFSETQISLHPSPSRLGHGGVSRSSQT